MESVIQIKQPMVRDFSTGGGHGPGDTIVEGDSKIVTKKWQGYAPQNLNVVGKPMPPLPEVAIPRFLGKAEYATRVVLPNMLHVKILTSPHPRARIQRIDTSRAEKMPGVARILTYRDFEDQKPIFGMMGPFNFLTRELGFFGEIVAVVAADTEDLAEDAVEAIDVQYEVLSSVPTLKHVMSPGAPDIRAGKGNLILVDPRNAHYDPGATWVSKHGDVDKGFADADVIREFSYSFGGATAVPMQPVSCVARWDGDKLTFWGMGQGINPNRSDLAKGLGIDISKVRYINKYNGCTFGAAMQAPRFNLFVAYIAKLTGRPVRLMLHKDQELAHINIKPENLSKFKVGAKKDGRIVALLHEIYISGGDIEGGGHAVLEISKNNHELYTTKVPHWKSAWYNYRTNVIKAGPVRSYTQQEVKWAWENMMDEMAEALGLDPIQFRLMHVARPGTVMTKDWHEDFGDRYETENGELRYDSFASVEVLEEGSKAIGWDRRNPRAGGNPGRFKRGIGVAMSQHHAGHMGYHDGEVAFEKLTAGTTLAGVGMFGAAVEVTADGYVNMRNALPDSGTNHDTALAQIVAEMLGFTTRDRVRVTWGDSDVAPSSGMWYAGQTITLQGAAVCAAADKLRKDLLRRGAASLKVDPSRLQLKDGVISSMDDPKKRTTFTELVALNKGPIRQEGRGTHKDQGRSMTKGVAAASSKLKWIHGPRTGASSGQCTVTTSAWWSIRSSGKRICTDRLCRASR